MIKNIELARTSITGRLVLPEFHLVRRMRPSFIRAAIDANHARQAYDPYKALNQAYRQRNGLPVSMV